MKIFIIIFTFFIGFFVSTKFCPLVILISKKYILFDQPGKRKEHKSPKSRIGGLSIYLGFLISLTIGLISLFLISEVDSVMLSNIIFILPISTGFFLLGFIDDLYQLSPILRLVFQFFLIVILYSL